MSCISFGVSSSLQVPAPGCFSSVEGLLEVQRRIGPLGSCSWRSRLLGQCPHHMRCRSPCGSELGWKPFHGFSGALENLTCRVCRVRFFFFGARSTRCDIPVQIEAKSDRLTPLPWCTFKTCNMLNFKSPGQFRRNGTLIFCRCAKVNLVSDMANPEMKCDWGCVCFCCSGDVLTQHVETEMLLDKLRMIMGSASLTMRCNTCRLVELHFFLGYLACR